MIFNLTYRDKHILLEVERQVGKPVEFLKRLKMKGVGSPGLLIVDCDPEISSRLPGNDTIRKCNIELRPAGLIVGFGLRQQNFGWVIPYNQLSIFYSGNNLNLYAGAHRMKLHWPAASAAHRSFLSKLLDCRSNFLLNGDVTIL